MTAPAFASFLHDAERLIDDPAENIHRVTASGPGKTISIHLYGADIERLGSNIDRRFDDALLTQPPRAPLYVRDRDQHDTHRATRRRAGLGGSA